MGGGVETWDDVIDHIYRCVYIYDSIYIHICIWFYIYMYIKWYMMYTYIFKTWPKRGRGWHFGAVLMICGCLRSLEEARYCGEGTNGEEDFDWWDYWALLGQIYTLKSIGGLVERNICWKLEIIVYIYIYYITLCIYIYYIILCIYNIYI